MHRVAQRRQRGFDRGDLGALVDDLVAVAVAVDREQHRRARSARSGRRPTACRTPARTTTTPRRGSRWRGTRRSSRGCSAGTRRRGRPRCTPSRTKPGPAPGHRVGELRPRELDRCARSGCARRPRPRRAESLRRRERVLARSSALPRGTSWRRACARSPSAAVGRVVPADARPLGDRRARSRRGRRPTTATARGTPSKRRSRMLGEPVGGTRRSRVVVQHVGAAASTGSRLASTLVIADRQVP